MLNLQRELKSKAKLKAEISKITENIDLVDYTLKTIIEDNSIDENIPLINEMESLLSETSKTLRSFTTSLMFKNKEDAYDAFLDIQSGSVATEAQDWVEMLMRMYIKWIESHNFKCEIIEVTEGEVAGLKSTSLKISGDYAYGWLRTETGIHRLVRKSPFDSGSRRHTSFASVFVYPKVENDIEIDINPADLRIDVYRASGAGGQHVNTTESAVRITHLPTKIVTQCQNDRHSIRTKTML